MASKDDGVPALTLKEVQERYPRLFRQYGFLSEREKSSPDDIANGDPVPDGLCTTIFFQDFAAPLQRDHDESNPVKTESDANKFGMFLLKMLRACESGSVGGDACRLRDIMYAAVEDILVIPSDNKRFEHLLGFTMAVSSHGLDSFLMRGDPDTGRYIFKAVADDWKKLFDRNIEDFVSDEMRKLAITWCEALQKMLKSARKEHGEYATNYLFNFIRIPRPKKMATPVESATGTAAVSETHNQNENEAPPAATHAAPVIFKEMKPWEEEYWVPMTATGKQKTPNQIRNEIQRYIDECNANGTLNQTQIVRKMGLNYSSFSKFMNPKSYKNQWLATKNMTYLAGAKFLEEVKMEKEAQKKSGEKRKTTTSGSKSTAKKAKTSAAELIERINAVEGVSSDIVYDTCPEIVAKIKIFLQRDGMTKASLLKALGNINSNSLNKFLAGKKQDQRGNVTYRNAYAFFEKLRILEGAPKNSARIKNEEENPLGFSLEGLKGGRPLFFYGVPGEF